MENRRILVTGGAGGVGATVCRKLAGEGFSVRVFDLPTELNKKVFLPNEPGLELFWGDLTNRDTLRDAVNGVDEVVHLAAILPPATERNPQLAEKVNVGGTKALTEAVAAESERVGKSITFRFSSSVAVYGITNHLTPPLPPEQPVNPCDNYSETKVKAEEIVRASGLPWMIFRFSAAVYLSIRKGGFDQMRIIPPENRLEFVHIYDVADAIFHSIDNKEALNKSLVLAGGPGCQLIYRDQIKRTFDLLGFPEPDWRKFSKQPFNLDWYDTTESNRILKFQSRDFEAYLLDFKKTLGWRYTACKTLAGPAMKILKIHI